MRIEPTPDDWTEAALSCDGLVRVPVETGHVRMTLDGDAVLVYEYVGADPEPGDVFSALCTECPEVHMIVLRSPTGWHLAQPEWDV